MRHGLLAASSRPLAFGAAHVLVFTWLAVFSVPVASAQDAAPPGQVDTVGATAGDGSVRVTWSVPATGGTPARYTAVASPGGASCTSDGAPACEIAGLDNGVAYEIRVRARNAAGEAPASAPSAPVRPRPASFPEAGFPDVPDGSYYDAAVDWMALFGISRGTADGRYEPDLSITRAQMAAFLWRMMDAPTGSPPHGFRDVPRGTYFEEAVKWLRATGVTTGKTAQRYAPGDDVSRAQMAAFLWRMAGAPEGGSEHGFADVPAGAYFDEPVKWLREHDVTTGRTPKRFAPNEPVTRAQMAAFLHRLALGQEAWATDVSVPSTVLFSYNELQAGVSLKRVDHLVTGAQPAGHDAMQLTFPASDAPEVGDVVNSGPSGLLPSGILARVTSVATSDGQATAVTEPVALTEVVPAGRFLVNTAGASADAPSGGVAAQSVTAQQASVFAPHSERIPCGPSAEVSLDVDPWVRQSTALGAAWSRSGGAEASFEGSAEIGAVVDLAIEAGAACEWAKTLQGPRLGIFTVPIGPLLVPFTLDAVAELKLTTAAEAALNVSGQANAGLEVYAWYLDGETGGSLSPIRSAALEASLDGKVSARLDLAGKVRMRALNVGGPEVGVGPFVEATATPDESPCLTVDAGIAAGLDVALQVWKVDASWSVVGGDLDRWNLVSRTSPCPTGGDAIDIDAAGNGGHVCALREGGAVACWGANWAGQVGDGTRSDRQIPADVPGIAGAVDVSAGDQHTCAVHGDGRVSCWGSNGYGQLGDGTSGAAYQLTPVQVVGVTDATAVAAGGMHTCALRAGGTVACWGGNDSGQVGDGTRTNRTSPVDVLTGAVKITAGGWGNTCAVRTDATVACWGSNSNGQIGDGTYSDDTENDRLSPAQVVGIADAVDVSTGNTHTCAARASGDVACWGLDWWGTHGIGEDPEPHPCVPDCAPQDYPTPQRTLGIGDAASIEVSGSHSCALRSNRTVTCWGLNWWGQIGNGKTDEEVYEAGEGPALTDLVDVAAGSFGTCALDRGGNVHCWGNNASGALGAPTEEQFQPTPVRVVGFGG